MNYKDFKTIIEDDLKADENELREFLLAELPKIPVPIVNVNTNTFIERAVLIDKSQGDFDLSRLSYIPDHIKHITPEGRFNNAGEPHFYGTFTDYENPEATRFYLATEIDQSILERQTKTFNYTVGKWKSIDGFQSILFMFENSYCKNNLIRTAYNSYLNSQVYVGLSDEQKHLLVLITTELAKIKSANGYTITNIVFNFYKSKGFQSIIYPGVPGKYRGNNIAMTPSIFDRCFRFYMGAEFCLTQTEDDIDISVVYKIEHNTDKTLQYSTFGDDEIGVGSSIEK